MLKIKSNKYINYILVFFVFLILLINATNLLESEISLNNFQINGFTGKEGSFFSNQERSEIHTITSIVEIKKNRDYKISFNALNQSESNYRINVDFYNAGYDNQEQEFNYVVKSGAKHYIEGVLNTGKSPPSAFLRIFYHGNNDLTIENIKLYKISRFQKLIDFLFIVVVFFLILNNKNNIYILLRKIKCKYKIISVYIEKKFILLLIIYIILVFIRYFIYALTPYWGGDEFLYKLIALGIWNGVKVRPEMIGMPTNIPNLFYPWLISYSNYYPGASYDIIRFMNSAIINLCIFPAYYISKSINNHKISIVVAVLSALIPFVNIGAYAVTEVLYYPIFLTLIALYINNDNQRYSNWIFYSLIVSLLMQVKIMAFIIVPFVIITDVFINKNKHFVVYIKYIIFILLTYIFNMVFNYVLSVDKVGGIGFYGNVLSNFNSTLNIIINNPLGFLYLIAGHISILFIPYGLIFSYCLVALFSEMGQIKKIELLKFQAITIFFAAGLIIFTILFTVSVSPYDLGGLGRWHSRYYFYIQPLFIGYLFYLLRNQLTIKYRKLFLIISGALALICLYFYINIDPLNNMWIGSTVDNIDIQWYKISKITFYILFTLQIICLYFLYNLNKIGIYLNILLLCIYLTVANIGNWKISDVGFGDNRSECSKRVFEILEANNGKYALLAGSRKALVEIIFWQSKIPEYSCDECSSSKTNILNLINNKKIKYIIINDLDLDLDINILGNPLYEKQNCKLYKI